MQPQHPEPASLQLPEQPDIMYINQHLRSIIIHSIDNFNYNNAEFASERLLALDSENLDSVYLYCLALFHQAKFKSCYSKLINLLGRNHLGCSFLFAKCCLKLKRYKEGIYQLVRLSHMYNETSLESKHRKNTKTSSTYYFATPQLKYSYEHKRSIYPDSSIIHHLLADLYKGVNDIKNSALNYSQALKFNQFDFEAFQELCKLGVNVRAKSIYRCHQLFNSNITSHNESLVENLINSFTHEPTENISNPFTNSNNHNPTESIIHSNDSFNNSLSTPRVKQTSVPDAPLRKSNLNASNSNHFEFTKPNFPTDSTSIDKKHRIESTYSKITSRLISQPNNPDTSATQGSSKVPDTPAKKTGVRSSLKRNNSTGIVPVTPNDKNGQPNTILGNKEIEKSNQYLLKFYLIFAKGFKSMTKYDCYKAIRILESLPEKEKETPWVLSKLGRLHYEIVNYKQSEYFFVKLRQLDRTRLEDMEYYSTLLWHLHRKVELTYLSNELHDLNPNSPITWCAIGNLFSLTREPDEAIKCFSKATKFDDTFTYAYTLKGHEYFGNDNYEMALENFRISLLIDSRHYNALYGIGMVYINLGDYQKADYHFRKAVAINPINIILICCVGMVLEKLGKKNLALRQYELANKLQPLNPLPIFKKAQLLFSMQQFPQALVHFEILKDLAPDEASVHFLLGQLYNIQNDKFQAIREFTIALNLDPKGNYLIREAMESLKDK